MGLVRRAGVIVALAVTATALGITAANAQPVTTGSMSFSGDPGDFISGGGSFSYSTSAKDTLTVFGSADDHVVTMDISGANGDFWILDLAAPSGQALTAGTTYANATRYPFQAPTAPGLSLFGNGRGCNQVTGSFAVQNAVFGPNGYVQTLDATFEQHCEGGPTAARGEIHIANAPAPPQLGVGVNVSTNAKAVKLDGNAELTGTVTCNEPVSVAVSGLVTEVSHNVIIRGNYSTTVACVPGAGVAWAATAVPTGTTPYQKGKAEVQTTGSAVDPTYGNTVTVNKTTVVTLKSVPLPS
ncbi:MAG TPA: hypothetical protein VGL06_08655 [Pseudonocardiaceae bacterium]